MKITEIQIKNFGKLQNINIRPLPGINVIYGENETGKSTMQQFITGMMFGLEKQRGKSGKNDSYQQYEPWNSSSYYAGGMKFTVGGKPFFLERNFYHKEKSAKLINEGDMEELSVEHGDLEMLLGGMKKEIYENTYCIRQASVETRKEFTGILQNYFVNTSHGGDGSVNLLSARKRLKDGQKAAEQQYKEKLAVRKEAEEKLLLEEELLKKDVEDMKKQMDSCKNPTFQQQDTILPEHDTNQMAEYLRDVRQKKEKTGYKLKQVVSLVTVLVSLLLGIWNGAAHHLVKTPKAGWVVLEVFFAVLFLAGLFGLYYWHQKEMQLQKLLRQQEKEAEEMNRFNSRERERQRAKEQQEEQAKQQAVEELLQAQLLEKQAVLMNLQEELEECRRPAEEEIELARQIRAYELAYDTLQKLSQNVYEDTREQMEQEMSRILSELTGGKYSKIGLDEQMNLAAYEENRKLYPWQLSRGTMEQMYVALRLGAGRSFTKEESMPILLDEVFASFDEKRLEAALQWLGKQKEQIFLFTCHRREMEILERNGIPYGKIMLSR